MKLRKATFTKADTHDVTSVYYKEQDRDLKQLAFVIEHSPAFGPD